MIVVDPRLRGRARPADRRPPAQALAAPRRRRDAPLVREAVKRRTDPHSARAARGLGGPCARRVPARLPRRGPTRRLSVSSSPFERPLAVFELERRWTSCATSSNNGADTGLLSPSPGSRRGLERATASRRSAFFSARSTCTSPARDGTSGCTTCSARTCVDEGVSFAVWAPNARAVAAVGDFNDWISQLVDAEPWRVRHLGPLADKRRARGAHKFQVVQCGRHGQAEGRSVRVRVGGAAALPRPSSTCPSTRWGDEKWLERRRTTEPHGRADVRLRGAPRLLAAQPARGQPLTHVPRARAGARRLCARPRLHARRAAPGDGAPILGLVGLPGDRFLRADVALRRLRTTSAGSSTTCTTAGSA